MQRAVDRAKRFDRRYGRFTNFVGGFVASPAVLAADEEAKQAEAAEHRRHEPAPMPRDDHRAPKANAAATTVADG